MSSFSAAFSSSPAKELFKNHSQQQQQQQQHHYNNNNNSASPSAGSSYRGSAGAPGSSSLRGNFSNNNNSTVKTTKQQPKDVPKQRIAGFGVKEPTITEAQSQNNNSLLLSPSSVVVSADFHLSQLTTQLSKEFKKTLSEPFSSSKTTIEDSLSEEYAEILKSAIAEYPKSFKSERVQKAFKVCVEAHSGSGHRPLLLDCVGTAKILCDLGADDDVIAAALLHDISSTTLLNQEDLLNSDIDKDVIKLATDVGKLTLVTKLHQASGRALESEETSSFREMLLAMTDSRVVIIKLAKRLQVMRTINENVARSRRGKLAEETLAVFVPISHRLGMATLKNEMEDICFKTLHPEQYEDLKTQLKRVSSKETILKAMESFEYAISNDNSMEDLKPMEIVGREKGLYSVYKKMKKKNIKLEDVRDIRAIRIIIPDDAGKKGCDLVIEKVHELMQPVQGSFKDYISSPKLNGYQSLHTVVKDEAGNNLEVQVRTVSMHVRAEFGVAAHWRYKVNDSIHTSSSSSSSSLVDEGEIRWARYVLSFQQELKDETKVHLPGRTNKKMCPFPLHADSCEFSQLDYSVDVSGSFDEFVNASSPSTMNENESEQQMTYVIVVIDGSMSIQAVPEGSRLSEVNLLNDQKNNKSSLRSNGFSSESVGIRTLRVNRENVDIDDVHNFKMKLGDLIEVTRSKINRYNHFEKGNNNEESNNNNNNNNNNKESLVFPDYPDLEVHALMCGGAN